MNAACAKDWLPAQILLNTYKDSRTKSLVTYEEDIDVTTGALPGMTIAGENLKVWRETTLKYRDKDTQANNAAILGWEKDSTAGPAAYRISFNAPIAVDSSSSLLFSMAQGDIKELKLADKESHAPADGPRELNFQVQLTDSLGNDAVVDISDIKKPTPRLEVQYLKLKGPNQEGYGEVWEPTLETFELPLSRFKNPKARLGHIKSININFNGTENGVLILDEISLRHN